MRRGLRQNVVCVFVLSCAVGLVVGASGLSVASGAGGHGVAREAKTVSLVESAHLSVSKNEIAGSEIPETGSAKGTYNTYVSVGLTIHAHYVTAIVTVYPKGGSITGAADADYKVTGSVGAFHGTLTLTHGTGTYKHISGKLAFEGAINHENYQLWLIAKGSAKY